MNTLRWYVLLLSVRRRVCTAAIASVMFLAFLAPCSGQTSNNGQVNRPGQLTRRTPPPQRDIDPLQMETTGTPLFYEKRLKLLNAAQHQSMVADTDRLLKLVADLNSQINTSNANALTPEQLRMVAEIEKLAHSVRDKMRMSVRSSAEYNGPTSATPFGVR
jgi:hypothetical protein